MADRIVTTEGTAPQPDPALTAKERRRLAVEAFIEAHYEIACNSALELDWFEKHPEQAAHVAAALTPSQPVPSGLTEPTLTAIRQDHRVVDRPGIHGKESWCDEDNVRQPCDTQVVLGFLDATRARLTPTQPVPSGLDLDAIRDAVREAVIEGDASDCSSPDCIADVVYEIVRVHVAHRITGEGNG